MFWPLTEAQTITVITSILGALVAACAAMVTVRFANRNLQISVLSTRIKYFEDFRKWSDEVVDVMVEAIHLCDLDPTQTKGESVFDKRHPLLIRLSSLTDKGRWFFPNIMVDEHGSDKELGFRGYRHKLLDGVVGAYQATKRLDYKTCGHNGLTRNELTACKRHFVGQVQEILDPKSFHKEFRRIHAKVSERVENAQKF